MNTVQVAAGIIWRNGRFLAAQRPPDKPMAGYWEFPGGKCEQGESVAQALSRELSEELGITCTCSVPWTHIEHRYPHMVVDVYFLHVTAFDGDPAPRDGQELLWVTPDQARSMRFLPADTYIVRRIQPPVE